MINKNAILYFSPSEDNTKTRILLIEKINISRKNNSYGREYNMKMFKKLILNKS
jgi:hypothetical protein